MVLQPASIADSESLRKGNCAPLLFFLNKSSPDKVCVSVRLDFVVLYTTDRGIDSSTASAMSFTLVMPCSREARSSSSVLTYSRQVRLDGLSIVNL
jgi:hypothetical protein